MSIRFACQCGKPLQAREDFAGRKMRCPACGTVLTIPDAEGASPATPPTMARPPVAPVRPPLPLPPTPIAAEPPVATTRPHVAEFEVKPKKDEVPEVVAPKEDIASTEVPRPSWPRKEAKRPSRDIWADSTLTQETTPWPDGTKKRQGADLSRRNPGRVLIPLFVILCVIGGTAGVLLNYRWIDAAVQANQIDLNRRLVKQNRREFDPRWNGWTALDLLPPDAPIVVSLNPDVIWDLAQYLDVPQKTEPGAKTVEKIMVALDKLTTTSLGARAAQVERLIIYSTTHDVPAPGREMVLMQANSPYFKHWVLANVAGAPRTWSEPGTCFALKESPNPMAKRNPNLTLALLNDHLSVVGADDAVQTLLKEAQGKSKAAPTPTAPADSQKNRAIALHIDQPTKLNKLAQAGVGIPFAAWSKATAIDIVVDFTKTVTLDPNRQFAFTVKTSLQFSNAQEAQEAADAIPQIRAALMKAAQGKLQSPQLAIFQKTLERAKHLTKGDTLQITLVLDEPPLMVILPIMQNFMGGLAGMPFEGGAAPPQK